MLRRHVWSWMACLLYCGATVAYADSGTCDLPIHDTVQDDVWTISSREAGGDFDTAPRLTYWRYDHSQQRWTPADHAAFLAGDDPQTPTCVYVHGNRVDSHEAIDIGWQAYRNIKSQTPPGKRFRFVIWSWPSAQIPGPLVDVRVKAARCERHALYLAWLVDQMQPTSRVCLIGYSFGARMVAGSLHLLGGGQLAGRSLEAPINSSRQPLRAVLMAAAVDSQALLPNARNGRALAQVDRMLIMTNPTDDVLRHYRLLYGLGSKVRALGFAGAAGYESSPKSAKVTHWNVSRFVGAAHDCSRYLTSPAIISGMTGYALFLE